LREVAAIHRSDLTLMIADYEVELLIAEFGIPERQVAYLPFWLELDEAEFKPFESRQDFMMIGSFMHPPNVDAARWFKQAIWPLIREELPQAEFHCYGAYGDRYKTEFHDPGNGFIYKGRADDALLTMQNYRVNCVPLRYGAGLKGKVFDGFQTGTPTVTTPVGAEGINGNEAWGCTISDDPETFARTAVELYTNAEGWAKVQAQGQHIARKRFSANKWLPRLTQDIETALAQMNENRKRHFTGRMLRHHQHRSTEYMSRWIEAKNR
jgi:glycosyltransferase involved in cell wall biosynthesis